jgi:hypothetical protein
MVTDVQAITLIDPVMSVRKLLNFSSAAFSVGDGSWVEFVTLELCCIFLNCCRKCSTRNCRNQAEPGQWVQW